MIAGGSTPPFFYGFMCAEKTMWKWIWVTQLYSCCAFALVTVLCPSLKGHKWLNAVAWVVAGYSVTPGLIHLTWYPDTYMR